MKILLIRDDKSDKATIGHLNCYDDNNVPIFGCYSCELPDKDNSHNISCIPTGEYECQWNEMQSHKGHWHYLLQEVPDRGGIFIHYATMLSELKGCISLCDNVKIIGNNVYIIHSKEVTERFENLFLKDNIHQPFTLIIKDIV